MDQFIDENDDSPEEKNKNEDSINKNLKRRKDYNQMYYKDNKHQIPIYCGNCGHRGHVYRKCKKPITSFGIICMKRDPADQEVKILMVQRKDTMGYVEILRGKYPNNKNHIMTLLSEITENEKQRLLDYKFDELWNRLWVNHNSKCYRNEYYNAREKFNKLNINEMLSETKNIYQETEWGIPKGRRNKKENNIQCACREFEEETSYNPNEFELLPDPPLEEIFTGTNNKEYKHVYYLAKMNPECREPLLDKNNKNQIGEIRSIKWFGLEGILKEIREYDIEKKKIIKLAFEKMEKII